MKPFTASILLFAAIAPQALLAFPQTPTINYPDALSMISSTPTATPTPITTSTRCRNIKPAKKDYPSLEPIPATNSTTNSTTNSAADPAPDSATNPVSIPATNVTANVTTDPGASVNGTTTIAIIPTSSPTTETLLTKAEEAERARLAEEARLAVKGNGSMKIHGGHAFVASILLAVMTLIS